jgi:hypothetical protein
MATFTLRGPTYLSEGDEAAFFSWLEAIPGVTKVEGEHPDKLTLHIDDSKFTDETLRELLAVCHRYDVEMRQLARFETPSNRSWFRKSTAYWYKGVFG